MLIWFSHNSGGRHNQRQRQQMADQRGEENRDRHDFRREYRLGDQVRLVQQARRAALDGFAEQQPRQHPGENEQRVIVLARRRLLARGRSGKRTPSSATAPADESDPRSILLPSRQSAVRNRGAPVGTAGCAVPPDSAKKGFQGFVRALSIANNINFINNLQAFRRVDFAVMMLLQFEIRQ